MKIYILKTHLCKDLSVYQYLGITDSDACAGANYGLGKDAKTQHPSPGGLLKIRRQRNFQD